MPEFNCGACGKLLKTPAGSEGKQGRCPHCGGVMHIPGGQGSAAGGGPKKPPTAKPAAPNPTAPRPAQPQRPQQSRPQQTRPPQGAPRPAAQRPAPQKPFPPQPAPVARPAANPFGNQPAGGYNPYSSPRPTVATGPPGYGGGRGKPHRGGIVLALGIISLIMSLPAVACFCSCFVSLPIGLVSIGLGIPAWLMASTDLKEMKRGMMDNTGQGMTMAGMVMGIIGIVLSGLAALASIGITIFALVVDAS